MCGSTWETVEDEGRGRIFGRTDCSGGSAIGARYGVDDLVVGLIDTYPFAGGELGKDQIENERIRDQTAGVHVRLGLLACLISAWGDLRGVWKST